MSIKSPGTIQVPPHANTEEIAKPIIEKQLGENFRKAGDILCAYQADDGHCYFQAVMGNDVNDQVQLRLKSQPDTRLAIQALPYTLSIEE